jgi:hypothetical protein
MNFPFNVSVSKVPYGQLPLQLLIKRDLRDPNETTTGLPVNIVNGSINFDVGKMMMAGGMAAGLQVINTKGFFFFFFYVLYSTLHLLPPLRLHCVGGCWDRTQDCCDFGIGSQTL